MNTLLTAPVTTLLSQLFAEADASRAKLEQQFTAADRAAFIGNGDYHALYTQLKDAPLAVSQDTGALLYMLARATGARTIVEFGTSFGISTIHLAAAIRDNGGGKLISTEFEPSKVARARENLQAANLSDLVEIREGDALQTLAHDLPEVIDLVLLDGAKPLYPHILALVEPHLRPNALIIADNADWSRDYLAKVRATDGGYLSIPFADEVELSIRLGGTTQ